MDPPNSSSLPNSNTTIPVVATLPSYGSDSSTGKPISLWPGMFHSPVTQALWEARSHMFERLLDPPFSTKRDELRVCFLHLPFLCGDRVDSLFLFCGFQHCYAVDTTTRPLLLVTASVDKIVLKKPISVDIDLTIVGAVIWVGRSSIEIQLEVTQSTEGSSSSDSLALSANFIFVARDSKTGKAAPVNRLLPETEREQLLFKEAEARNNLKKRTRGGHKRELENGEVNRLQSLLAEGRIFCDMPALADKDSILLRDTSLENSLICQPQQRNIHGRIFGGFLMHRAFELAFSTAYAFAGLVPCFLEADLVDFLRPVDVGDFCVSNLVFSTQKLIQICL